MSEEIPIYAGISRPALMNLINAGNLGIGDTLYFKSADHPSADEMVLSIRDGFVTLSAIGGDDTVTSWKGESVSRYEVLDAPEEILSLTVDKTGLANQSDFYFKCLCDNESLFGDSVLYFDFKKNGTLIASFSSPISRGESGKVIMFSGGFQSDFASGDVFSAEVYCDDLGLFLAGDISPTVLYIGTREPSFAINIDSGVFVAPNQSGVSISSTDISDALGGSSPRSSFFVSNATGKKLFHVLYNSKADVYYAAKYKEVLS